jgi:hypothetical protein
MEIMDILAIVLGCLILFGLPMFVFFVWTNPYLKAKILTLLTGKTHGVFEIATDNMEVLTKVGKTGDRTVKIGESEWIINKGMFMRKLGVPVQHFHYDNIKPTTFRSEDILRTEFLIPEKINFPIKGSWQPTQEDIKRGKAEPITFEQNIIVEAKDIKPLIGTNWISYEEKPSVIHQFAPIFRPPQFSAYLQAEHAYAITNASIQKQREIEQAKQYAMLAMILSGFALLGVVGIAYMTMDNGNKIHDIAVAISQLNSTMATNRTVYI